MTYGSMPLLMRLAALQRIGRRHVIFLAVAQQIDGFSNIAGGKNAEFLRHEFLSE